MSINNFNDFLKNFYFTLIGFLVIAIIIFGIGHLLGLDNSTTNKVFLGIVIGIKISDIYYFNFIDLTKIESYRESLRDN